MENVHVVESSEGGIVDTLQRFIEGDSSGILVAETSLSYHVQASASLGVGLLGCRLTPR